jgi:hypothetical protein
MSDLIEQLEALRAEINTLLKPGVVRSELQTDLDLVEAIIGAMPGRIAKAVEWHNACAGETHQA